MRKLFDKLTGRDKLKAKIAKFKKLLEVAVISDVYKTLQIESLKRELEYFKQPVEKVEEVQEVLALGFAPFEEVPPKMLKVSKPENMKQIGHWLPEGYYAINYLNGKPYVLDRAGDKLFYSLETQKYGWDDCKLWFSGSYKFEEVENA